MERESEGEKFVTAILGFAPGEQLLLCTDGVTEARDEDGHFCPLAQRTALLKNPDAHTALDALPRDVHGHAEGPLPDDAAMLLLRYRGYGRDRGRRAPRGTVEGSWEWKICSYGESGRCPRRGRKVAWCNVRPRPGAWTMSTW